MSKLDDIFIKDKHIMISYNNVVMQKTFIGDFYAKSNITFINCVFKDLQNGIQVGNNSSFINCRIGNA